MNKKTRKRLDIFAIVMYFLLGFNLLSIYNNLFGYSLGIACLIAGLYGIVAVYKNKEFVF
jgi:predicted membrane protein